MIKGSFVALVTPFKSNGDLDEDALRSLVRFHLEQGTDGILPCGTTGESPTLNHDEHKRVIEICIEAVAGQVPVMAGTGSNSTQEAIALTQHAKFVKADVALVVTPYYNKPNQEGLYQHFKAVADNADIPIILYNIEGRTARNIETSTVARLAKDCPNIIGVKEASGDMEQMQSVRLACGDDFLIFSGDDTLTLPVMSIGGCGVISVVANIIPNKVAQLVKLAASGSWDEARALHYEILPLAQSMFSDTNPIPIKTACALMGLCEPHMRLPLTDLSEQLKQNLKSTLKQHDLLKGSTC